MTLRSYRDLEREVWDTGRCAGCGACVAVCPADMIRFIGLVPENTGYCKAESDGIPCGACYDACPRTGEGVPVDPLGPCRTVLAARAVEEVAHRQSGGAVTAILLGALEEGVIDGVVTVTGDPWTLEPRSTLITATGELVPHAGSRFAWRVPLLSVLKDAVIRQSCRHLAVVGLPCAATAVRKMKESENDLLRPFGDAVRVIIGLCCTETFEYDGLVGEVLGGRHGIEPWDVSRLDVRGGLQVTTLSGEVLEIPLADLDACVRPGCRICTDFSARDADISACSAGSPDGWTTIVLRTPRGEGIWSRACAGGTLEVSDAVDLPAMERLARRKMERSQSRGG